MNNSKTIKVAKLPECARNVLKKKPQEFKKKLPVKKMFAACDSIPDRIIVYYGKNVSFDKIDLTVKCKYERLRLTVPNIISKIKKIEKEKSQCEIESKKLYLEKQITKLKKEKSDYSEDLSLKKYISESKDILDILKKDNSRQNADIYFSIVKKYIGIDVITEMREGKRCEGCGVSLEEEDFSIDTLVICPECDCVNTTMGPSKYTRDAEYGNAVFDEDIVNFIKVLDKFEGKNSTPIDRNLYSELDEYMENIDMKKGEFYRNLPLTEDGEKKGTSKEILWQALERLGYNQYYDESSYICHVYWGWSLPDLSLFRDKLIEDYQNTQTIWKKIKGEYTRSASLGTQYRLYKQLLAVDYPYCKKSNFRIQEMVDSLRLHDHAWKRMCEEAGVKFFPTSS
jgi:hypothetical protein